MFRYGLTRGVDERRKKIGIVIIKHEKISYQDMSKLNEAFIRHSQKNAWKFGPE